MDLQRAQVSWRSAKQTRFQHSPLTPTTWTPFSKAQRKTRRPIRPKPLIPIFTSDVDMLDAEEEKRKDCLSSRISVLGHRRDRILFPECSSISVATSVDHQFTCEHHHSDLIDWNNERRSIVQIFLTGQSEDASRTEIEYWFSLF